MALKLFDSLFKAGLTPDARTYSAVMIACFKGHQVSHDCCAVGVAVVAVAVASHCCMLL